MKLNDAFVQTITSAYGEKGSQWINDLTNLIERCTQKWTLSEVKTIPNLTYNYVAYALRAGKPVVLKLRCNKHELEKEVSALQAFASYGVARMLNIDYALGAMLLECVQPGSSLVSLVPSKDMQATEIAARVLHRLHQAPIPDNKKFQTLEHVLPKFDTEFAALSPFIECARMLRAHLLATQPREVLLHGDFHHDNILLGENNRWLVIDPEGLIGDPGYDMGLFIRNPLALLLDQSEVKQLILNRIKDFSEFFGYDKERLRQWTYLQAISSAYWSLADGLEAKKHCAFLELFERM